MPWFLIKVAALLCNNFALLFNNNNSVYYIPIVVHTCPRCLMCPYDFYVLWSICCFWATHQGVQYFNAETFACQKIRESFDKNFRVWRFLELISRKNLSRTAKIQENNFSAFDIFTVKTQCASTIVSRIRYIYNNKYINVSVFDLRA